MPVFEPPKSKLREYIEDVAQRRPFRWFVSTDPMSNLPVQPLSLSPLALTRLEAVRKVVGPHFEYLPPYKGTHPSVKALIKLIHSYPEQALMWLKDIAYKPLSLGLRGRYLTTVEGGPTILMRPPFKGEQIPWHVVGHELGHHIQELEFLQRGGKNFLQLYKQYRNQLEALADWQTEVMGKISGASKTPYLYSLERSDPFVEFFKKRYRSKFDPTLTIQTPESVWKNVGNEIQRLQDEYWRRLGVLP